MTKQELQKMIGNNLMKQRLSQNMTREQLSEKVGISTTFYANIECGNKLMSLVTLRKLADTLCVSTDVLLYEDHTSTHLRSIEKLLKDQPECFVRYIEDMIRLTLDSFSQYETDGKTSEEEVLDQNGCVASP